MCSVHLLLLGMLDKAQLGPPPVRSQASLTGLLCGRVGLALLRMSEEALLQLPFERLLTALNSKQYAAFSRAPGQLLRQALSFRVSRRLAASQARLPRTFPTLPPPRVHCILPLALCGLWVQPWLLVRRPSTSAASGRSPCASGSSAVSSSESAGCSQQTL